MKYPINDPREVIRQVQTYLLEILYDRNVLPTIVIDGFYTPETREAVRQFQLDEGLAETGIVDYETWNALYREYLLILLRQDKKELVDDGAFDMRIGNVGHPIILLQSTLGELSLFYPVINRPAITGQFGYTTQEAVRALQRSYGLYETGEVDKALWARMTRDYEAKMSMETG